MTAGDWCEKVAKTDAQKRSESLKNLNIPKSAKTVENERKQAKSAKTIGVLFVDRFWPFPVQEIEWGLFGKGGVLQQ